MTAAEPQGRAGGVVPATVAFYLPQFHRIPENDLWWGEGFTEWTNVRRAVPLFDGHMQPNRPTGPMGQYDLTDGRVVAWQTELAMANGVDAFCYYHYWFEGGKRLLEEPLDNYLRTGLSMPFCICWANENWSRRWDGKSRDVLQPQNYGEGTPSAVFTSFLPYLRDGRYLKLHGRSVLLVHRADKLPRPREYAMTWREMARAEGIGELWLVASETYPGIDPATLGFDAVAEFPPVGDATLRTAAVLPPRGLSKSFRGRLLSYERLSAVYMSRRPPPFPRHRGLVPRWDNTPRRSHNGTIVVGSSPKIYAEWLAAARASEMAQRPDGGMVFVNAWNEWAEGAYLEPDEAFGDEYLRATRWDYVPVEQAETRGPSSAALTPAHLRSLAQLAAATLRNSARSIAREVSRGDAV